MATYDYKCSNGHTYTEERPMTAEDTAKICQECGKGLKRVFTANTIIFNGSGFNSRRG